MLHFEKILKIVVSRQREPKLCLWSIKHHQPSLIISRKFANLKPKMPGPKRFFLNSLPDYNNEPFDMKLQDLKLKLINYIPEIEEKQPQRKEDTEGGIYVGIPGIAYMFFHLSQLPVFSSDKEDFLNKALIYISTSAKHESSRTSAKHLGFLLGDDGIHAVAAAIYNALGKKITKYIKEKYSA